MRKKASSLWHLSQPPPEMEWLRRCSSMISCQRIVNLKEQSYLCSNLALREKENLSFFFPFMTWSIEMTVWTCFIRLPRIRFLLGDSYTQEWTVWQRLLFHSRWWETTQDTTAANYNISMWCKRHQMLQKSWWQKFPSSIELEHFFYHSVTMKWTFKWFAWNRSWGVIVFKVRINPYFLVCDNYNSLNKCKVFGSSFVFYLPLLTRVNILVLKKKSLFDSTKKNS